MKSVTIKNRGKADLVVGALDIVGENAAEFVHSSDCTTVAAGSSCVVKITFIPELPFGKKTASLTVSSNDPAKPALTVKLSGNATETGPSPKAFTFSTAKGSWIYYSSPAIGSDGTIYVGTGAEGPDVPDAGKTGTLYAVDPTGKEKWRFTDPDHVPLSSPVVAQDGTIYMQNTCGTLHALSRLGQVKWTLSKPFITDLLTIACQMAPIVPAVSGGDTIYFGGGDAFYSLNSAGEINWRYEGESMTPLSGSPVVTADGTILVPYGTAIHALDLDGNLKWKYLYGVGSVSVSSPAIAVDGTIYLGVANGSGIEPTHVLALNGDGTVKWRYNVPGLADDRIIHSSPSIGPDGTIYIGTKATNSTPAEMLALTPEGVLKWSYSVRRVHKTPDDIYSTAAIGADGIIYFGAEAGGIFALNPDGSLKKKYSVGSTNYSSPAISTGGILYVGDTKGKLRAIKVPSHGLADSPWPKINRNNQNMRN